MTLNPWAVHLVVFGLSVAFKAAEVWYIQCVERHKVLLVAIAAPVASALGLGPAIWATQQPEHVATLFLCLVLGQGLGAYLRMALTERRWL